MVGIQPSGKSLPRRCASLLHIIESWLSKAFQFISHRLLETPSVLIYVPTRVSRCARWRVSRTEKMSGSTSVLREQSRPGGWERTHFPVEGGWSSRSNTNDRSRDTLRKTQGSLNPNFLVCKTVIWHTCLTFMSQGCSEIAAWSQLLTDHCIKEFL